MLGQNPFGACLPVFASCADRYCLDGYGKGATTVEGMLELALKVEPIDGLELVGNWHVNDDTIHDVGKRFKDENLKIPSIVPDLWTQEKWAMGSFTAADPKMRQAAVDEVKKCMDWAAELDCPYVNVWPGQDGFDYCFHADYQAAWKWMREGLEKCVGYKDKVRLVVEYKLKEPRRHIFMNSAAKVLLMLQDLDVGVVLDAGHALAAGENMAEVAVLLHDYGKLDYVHLNDNWRAWDDDMMVGAVHLVEYLEFVYWLKRIDYKGWLSLDIFPYREDGVGASIQSYEWMEAFYRAVDRVGMDEIAEVIRKADGVVAVEMVRKAMNT